MSEAYRFGIEEEFFVVDAATYAVQRRMPGGFFDELKARVAKTLAFIGGLDAAAFAGSEPREIVLRPGTPKERTLDGQSYLLHYGLPQFFFHVTTVYALLRHNGVEIGKRDYMGAY